MISLFLLIIFTFAFQLSLTDTFLRGISLTGEAFVVDGSNVYLMGLFSKLDYTAFSKGPEFYI